MNYNELREKFSCKCGCGFSSMDILLVHLYEFVSDITGISITSGCRCPEHNKKVGGHENSYHTKGMALDIKCDERLFAMNLIRAFCIKNGINFVDVVPFLNCYLHIEIDYNKIEPKTS